MNEDELINGLASISCYPCKHFNHEYMECEKDLKCNQFITEAISYLKKSKWHNFENGHDVPLTSEPVICETVDLFGKTEHVLCRYYARENVFVSGAHKYKIAQGKTETFIPEVTRWKNI